MSAPAGYILTEIWKPRPAWLALAADERRAFFDEKVNPFLGSQLENGAEILACAINDNTGDERIDYSFMAIWRFKDKQTSDALEAGAKAMGFLDYFEQVNFSGPAIPPPGLNQAMLEV